MFWLYVTIVYRVLSEAGHILQLKHVGITILYIT